MGRSIGVGIPGARTAFVTGGSGFTGRHLAAHLRELGHEVVAPAHAELDLLDRDAVRAAVAGAEPGAVFHLAAHTSVPGSWRDPRRPLSENPVMTLNVLDAVRLEAPDAVVLIAGSAEIYGAPERLPVTEDTPLRPQNPYSVSKAAGDLLAAQWAESYDLSVVRTRTFNSAGPGQSDEYVVGTLARQIAEGELAGRSAIAVRVGNLEPRRDVTDVRDVVRAYAAAVRLPTGPYNVCSGTSASVAELLDAARRVSGLELTVEVDPARVRDRDVPEILGSAERLRARTGWEPQIPLDQTVQSAIAAWRERLG